VVKQKNIPAVMTLHDYKLLSPNYNLFHHNKIGEECAGGNYYQCILHNCLESFGRSVLGTVEEYYAVKKYQAVIKKFIAPSNFLQNKFIANGFNKEQLVMVSHPFTKSIKISQAEGKYVLFVGRLVAEKGPDLLLKAAKLLPEIKFLIVGDGSLAFSLRQEKIVKNLHNVEFTGYQQGEELDNLYLNAEMLVAPCVWYEIALLSALEGMGSGKIVLGANIGGIPEFLPKEFLFKVGDVQDLVKKIKFWHEKSFNEKQAAGEKLRGIVEEKFSAEKYIKNLLSVYQTLLK
jgi:glycosyltransferase involved in cell wall biosynthesis